jgi:hypothetical protein
MELRLGRKPGLSLLARVGAAIAQFVSPIDSSSAKQRVDRFERAKPKKEESAPKDDGKSARPRVLKAVPKEQPSPAAVEAPRPATGASVATAFLELFNFLQVRKQKFLLMWGKQAYKDSAREHKKAGRFRKGTMLDRRAG